MNELESTIDLDQEVNFDYPAGLEEAAAILDFIPDEQARVAIMTAFVNNITLL